MTRRRAAEPPAASAVSRRGFLTGRFLAALRSTSEPPASSAATAPDSDPSPPAQDPTVPLPSSLSAPAVGPSPPPPAPSSAPPSLSSWRGQRLPVLRPPGAIEERAFLEGCTRCGACVEACPTGALVPAGVRHHSTVGFPLLDPSAGACTMCSPAPCIQACEPGVLSSSIPVKLGQAHVVHARCLLSSGLACDLCAAHCPVPGALSIQADTVSIHAETCTGCGSCRHVCPAPVNAVVIVPTRRRPARPSSSIETPGE
jgi:ferredoxin-type protein NapG